MDFHIDPFETALLVLPVGVAGEMPSMAYQIAPPRDTVPPFWSSTCSDVCLWGGSVEFFKGMSDMAMTGTIGRYFDQKGFGFIKPDDGDKDLFVHITEVKTEGISTLTEGQRVTYESIEGAKGPKAVNVEIVG